MCNVARDSSCNVQILKWTYIDVILMSLILLPNNITKTIFLQRHHDVNNRQQCQNIMSIFLENSLHTHFYKIRLLVYTKFTRI
jgi:hypothetical protein